MTVHVTIEMDEAVKAKLDALATGRGVPVDEVIAYAVTDMAEEEAAFLAAVDEGLTSLADHGGIPHEEVVAEAMRRRAERNRTS
jgi:predicted transcriptional regulator